MQATNPTSITVVTTEEFERQLEEIEYGSY